MNLLEVKSLLLSLSLQYKRTFILHNKSLFATSSILKNIMNRIQLNINIGRHVLCAK